MKYILATLLIAFLSSCKQEAINTDPRKQILGKWEIFYLGNGEYRPQITNPSCYQEFLPDSVLLEYDYSKKTTYRRKYWIDSLLHMGSLRPDGIWLTFDYGLQFNKDTMRLEKKNVLAIFHVSKYKRTN